MLNKKISAIIGSALGLIMFLLIIPSVSASTNIVSTTYPYAWGTDIGWVNFYTDGGNLTVSSTGLTGYAWSTNYGWLNFNPNCGSGTEGCGVANDGNGNLSGYAWSENVGWLSFNGVKINTSTGRFYDISTTTAGDTNGQLNFDCTSSGSPLCNVVTGWRPTVVVVDVCDNDDHCDAGETHANCSSDCPSAPPVNPPSGGGGGGYSAPKITGAKAEIINSNYDNRTITLKLSADNSIISVTVSENSTFSGESWWPYSASGYIYKVKGANSGSVYVKVKNSSSESDPFVVNYSLSANATPVGDLVPGDLIKTANNPAIYYINSENKRQLYSNSATFWSWHTGSWSNIKSGNTTKTIKKVSQSILDSIVVGKNVTVKPGAKLMKFDNSPQVYTVFGNAKLKSLTDQEAVTFYGNGRNWKEGAITIQTSFEADYAKANADFADSDSDGLSNDDESNTYGTNPNNPDSDGDGYRDGWEVISGYSPNGPGKL